MSDFDALIIGSGFGGAMAARRLVEAGWRVLLLERGEFVARGPASRDPHATLELTPHYSYESAYRSIAGGYGPEIGSVFCVGGPSVYYGGAAFRFRVADFTPDPEIVGGSGAEWPFGYDDLEPYYGQAEQALGVAGDDEGDPAPPPRSTPFPAPPGKLAAVSERFADVARGLGLSPVRLPLTINYRDNGRAACDACRLCDTYACAIEAKNDTEVAVLRPLQANGLDLRAGMVVTRLVSSGGRISEVVAWDKARGQEARFTARHVVLAAGTLASPHLLLASRLERENPAGGVVGRYLTRHCCGMVFGFCNFRPDPGKVFHKQLAVLDYYFGDPHDARYRARRIGSIQQICPPPAPLMKAHLPGFFEKIKLTGFVEHLTSALVIAEDEPRAENRVWLDPSGQDAFGVPRLCVEHRYTRADEQRRRLLYRRTKRILRGVGAWSFYSHDIKTFSHALGTVRMGPNATTAPLDGDCRFRGIENLLVVDGSVLPTAGGVNPSLTIAAVALRAADRLVARDARSQ